MQNDLMGYHFDALFTLQMYIGKVRWLLIQASGYSFQFFVMSFRKTSLHLRWPAWALNANTL